MDALLDTSYAAIPNIVDVTTTTRKVSGEMRFGRELRKRSQRELRETGRRTSPKVTWEEALKLYEATQDERVFERPARDYDAALLDPNAPPYKHPALKKGVWPEQARGLCSGQIGIQPIDQERETSDLFYGQHKLDSTPAHGIIPAEVMGLLAIRAARDTLFVSEVWLEGIVAAGRAVSIARQ